ncbi:Hint domain-containing protein [Marimonas sp. MJW-29]|uniref:Hint domain-containing protein n=1 Tax=Sulfitobacter sediminis TaxID=3234186 RepID=A0ABV3RTF8_9RHOB
MGNAQVLWISQQHRMVFSEAEIELIFGEPEVLIPAKHLFERQGIEIIELSSVEYFHMLFDQHEIVFAECIESESFHPGTLGMQILSDEAKADLYEFFPDLAIDPISYGGSARLSLKAFETRVLHA